MCSLLLGHTIKSYRLFIVAFTKIVRKRENLGLKRKKKLFRRHKEIQMNRIDRNVVWRERDGKGDKCAKMQQCKRAPPEQSHIYYCCFYASDLK